MPQLSTARTNDATNRAVANSNLTSSLRESELPVSAEIDATGEEIGATGKETGATGKETGTGGEETGTAAEDFTAGGEEISASGEGFTAGGEEIGAGGWDFAAGGEEIGAGDEDGRSESVLGKGESAWNGGGGGDRVGSSDGGGGATITVIVAGSTSKLTSSTSSSKAMLVRKDGFSAAAVISSAVGPPSVCTMDTRTLLSPRPSRVICSAVIVTDGVPAAKDLITEASTASKLMVASARCRRGVPTSREKEEAGTAISPSGEGGGEGGGGSAFDSPAAW